MSNVPAELLEYVKELTWRKVATLVALALLGIFLFSLYERYTSSFQLSRLQRAADLVHRLHEMEALSTNATPELTAIRTQLFSQTKEALDQPPITFEYIPSKLTLSLDWLWKFLTGAFVFFGCAVVKAIKELRWNDQNDPTKIRRLTGQLQTRGILVMSFFSGISALFLPFNWWPWAHLLGAPLFFLLLSVLIIVSAAVVKGK